MDMLVGPEGFMIPKRPEMGKETVVNGVLGIAIAGSGFLQDEIFPMCAGRTFGYLLAHL
jgi:hypothetical protein